LRKLLSEYRALLKPLAIEGAPDLFIFRPVAFLLVQVLRRFPITPNQVSFSAIGTGLLCGFCLSLGTRRSFLWAGSIYLLTVVLDCADGMLARLKGSGTPLGRVVDGFIDYSNGVAVMIGLGIGTSRMGLDLPLGPWPVVALAGASMALHCGVVDYFRGQYALHALGSKDSLFEDIRRQEGMLSALKDEGARPLRGLVLRISLAYHKGQARLAAAPRRFDAREYARYNRWTLRGWYMIELTVHIVVLVVSAFLYDPRIFFVYAIIIGNAWLLLMIPVQYFVNRRVAARSRPAGSAEDGRGPADGIS
jgi:phosphatidylglycerophosphate synthase